VGATAIEKETFLGLALATSSINDDEYDSSNGKFSVNSSNY
jgi:hypothetical protein